MQAIQEPQQAAMPLIKVYLTDVQFEELKHILSNNISEDLVRAIVKEEIANDNLKAPLLKAKGLCSMDRRKRSNSKRA